MSEVQKSPGQAGIDSVLRLLTCKILVAFLFSNLTLKGVNLQKFGGVTTYIVYTLKYHVIEKVQIVSLVKNILRNSV